MNKLEKETIKRVMREVTGLVLFNLNSHPNPFLNDLNDKNGLRSRPYFEHDINCGSCDEWADEVERRLRDLVVVHVEDNNAYPKYEHLANHVFIRIGKKFYDCECLDGVSRIDKLPIYSRNVKLSREDCRKFYS